MELPFSGSVISHNVAVSEKFVFVGYESLEANRPSGMNLAGADADLRAEAVAESVRKARGTVLVYAGGIHHFHETGCGFGIFRDDAVRVMRAIAVNMPCRLIHTAHQLDGKNKIQILDKFLFRDHLKRRRCLACACLLRSGFACLLRSG